MKKIYIITVIVLNFLLSNAFSQSYHLNVRAGAGYARFLTDMDYDGINKSGFNGSFRIMWQPEHLLSLGLETGYNTLYTYEQSTIESEFGTTSANASLNSIPVFLVLSMQITDAIHFTGGFGPSFLKTSFESFDLKTTSSQSSTSYFMATDYEHYLSKNFSLGGELRWYYIHKIQDGTLSLNLTLGYRLFSW